MVSKANYYKGVKKVLLSPDEAKLVSKIASITRMDCWFSLVVVDNGYMVYDLERGRIVSTRNAIRDLCEGIPPNFNFGNGLNVVIFKNLIERLNLSAYL